MTCPKCKAKVGIMSHEIILAHGVVNGCKCVICGYWKFEDRMKVITVPRQSSVG